MNEFKEALMPWLLPAAIVALLLVVLGIWILFRRQIPRRQEAETNRPGRAQREVKQLLFADGSLAQLASMTPAFAPAAATDPLSRFSRAQRYVKQGAIDRAVVELRAAVASPAIETRLALWAWNELRLLGQQPQAPTVVRGLVIESPAEGGSDTLALYEDGRICYLSALGKLLTWDHPHDPHFRSRCAALLQQAQRIAGQVPPVEKRAKDPSPGVRLTLLTFGGTRVTDVDLRQITQPDHPLHTLFEQSQQLLRDLIDHALKQQPATP